ncbi:PREDICTED: probable calcium-binding protein CML30 [Populus euphratica]|uniref:Probable calcium-binding protein CML30 n=1 Tax=Populus euphratica TaxID=75702 RepID=A0AAJ6XQT2_POPEU|nr:PREDICTED: probable calcium-binding protein CML30 [Populus euphratica]
MVMNRLGLVFHEDCLGGDEGFGADELLSLFEEEEPRSLEEVKEVFDVFDENKDGFIDARELNRVMRRLGLKEGMEVEECSRMIQAVGKDTKEKIDFNDFFRFMERCYY